MIRYSGAVCLWLLVLGCAANAPQPQPEEVLEASRKKTAEIEKELDAIKKSNEKVERKIQEMKQAPVAPADLL